MGFEKVKLNGMTIGLWNPETKVYRTSRHHPQDVARRFNAYGIDAPTIERLFELGAEVVQIEEHRGKSIRLYTTPVDQWIDAPVDKLGDKGLPHHFVPLAQLPVPEVLKGEACGRRLPCCSEGRCGTWLGHVDAQDPDPHACGRCGNPITVRDLLQRDLNNVRHRA